MVGVPELVHVSRAVDILLAPGGGDADGDILQRAAKAAHGVALEMGEHQKGIVIGQVGPHEVLLDDLAAGDGQLYVVRLVHDVHLGGAEPAVALHGDLVGVGGVAPAVVGGIALHDGAAHVVDHRLHEVGAQEVLVSGLAGVDFDGHFSLQLDAQGAVQPEHGGGGEVTGEIDGGFHGGPPHEKNILCSSPLYNNGDGPSRGAVRKDRRIAGCNRRRSMIKF